MEFFRNSNFNFMGARKFFLPISAVAFVGALAVLFVGNLNIGIDFAGGTQLTAKFQEKPDVAQLRELLTQGGIEDAQIQEFGQDGDNEVIIKTPTVEGDDEGSRRQVEALFDSAFNPDLGGRLDLNQRGARSLAELLASEDPDGIGNEDPEALSAHYNTVAEAVMSVRTTSGLLADWSELDGVEELSAECRAALERSTAIGTYSIISGDYVGPQIGSELRLKGILAVLFSLVGMMVYIWLRFELRFGIGAVAALAHDVTICLGLYALAGYQFDLTTIAAFLTIVGYSVNDSVVVFDRVRENLRRSRREPLVSVINRSLNQTLSRTVLTSGTTLLAVTTLFVFGGGVIRGLAFVLLTGVVIGTYSSLFVASPFVIFWERWFGRRR